jgi:hypothetical protein
MSIGLPCPAEGCNRQRRSVGELLCPRCWYRVPSDLRSQVWRAWRAYNDDRISLPELRGIQHAAIDALPPIGGQP